MGTVDETRVQMQQPVKADVHQGDGEENWTDLPVETGDKKEKRRKT